MEVNYETELKEIILDNSDIFSSGRASKTIIDIPETFQAHIRSVDESSASTPPPEPMSMDLLEQYNNNTDIGDDKMVHYRDIHSEGSKIRPFSSVDINELTTVLKQRGIYHETEKDLAPSSLRAPTPIRLMRPLSKIISTTNNTKNNLMTPNSSPPETPIPTMDINNNNENAKISAIKEDLADAKTIMLENLQSVVERGPELEQLHQQSGINNFLYFS